MKFVKDKEELLSDAVEVSIEYDTEDGYYDANITLDGHCVAFFSSDGELYLLPFEVRHGEDEGALNMLRSKGIKFTKKKKADWDEYYIKVAK